MAYLYEKAMKRSTPLRADPAKTRDWQDRSRKPLERSTKLRDVAKLSPGKPLERSGPLPKVNRKRKAKLQADQFGPPGFADWVRSLGCSVPACGRTDIEAAHATSRGAGGNWGDVLPLCSSHHRSQHAKGIETFERHVGFRLADVAASVQMRWRQFAGEPAE